MKRFLLSFVLMISAATFAFAQGVPLESTAKVATQNDDDLKKNFGEFSLELPNKIWKTTSKIADAAANNIEFIYGDRMDGYLQIRKVAVDEKETLADIIEREQAQKLQFLPAFVNGKEETFKGRLSGKVANYEFTQSGKPMIGRAYFLQAEDGKNVYILRFTGLRDKLKLLRNQTDMISRTFKVEIGKREGQ